MVAVSFFLHYFLYLRFVYAYHDCMIEALRSALPQHLQNHLASARELAHRHAAAPTSAFSTTVDSFDALLAGGLHRGQMVELIGERSSGRFSTVLAIIAATTTMGEAAALVDLGDGLDPQTAAAVGVDLERLLWVRPQHLKKAMISAEMLLAGGFPLVIVDLGNPPVPGGRGAEAAWLRLARSAQSHDAVLLVSSPYRASGTAAIGVVKATHGRPRWSSNGLAPHLLLGLSSRLTLEKLRGHQGTRHDTLRLMTPEAAAFRSSGDRPPPLLHSSTAREGTRPSPTKVGASPAPTVSPCPD